jgi:hypothetical protein
LLCRSEAAWCTQYDARNWEIPRIDIALFAINKSRAIFWRDLPPFCCANLEWDKGVFAKTGSHKSLPSELTVQT